MTDGLKDKHREAIIAILATHSRVERAVLFGSRAVGTFTVTSDVDIALFGDSLTLDDQAGLSAAMEELPIPQRVDLIRHNTIKNKKLLAHIREYGIEWFNRAKLAKGSALVEEQSIPVIRQDEVDTDREPRDQDKET